MKYLQVTAPHKTCLAVFEAVEEDGKKFVWHLVVQLFALTEDHEIVPLVLSEDGDFFDPRNRDSFQKITGVE